MPDQSSPAGSPANRPSVANAWWQALRPKTLLVSFSPVLAGTALAYSETGTWLPWVAGLAMLAAVLIQIGTNLHNDVSDFERGADAPDRLGPPRATAMGWLPARAVRLGAWSSFALAFLLGIVLVAHGGWPIVVIGLASLVAGWAYTGGPKPVAYTPLGELFVVVFFGLCAVGGSYYLQTASISLAAVWLSLALGSFAAAVISVNNTRDLVTDARVGKRTLAVRLGRAAMNRIYALELALPFVLLIPVLPSAWALLPAATLPVAVWLHRRFLEADEGGGFNRLLAGTARLQAIHAALLAVALVLRTGA